MLKFESCTKAQTLTPAVGQNRLRAITLILWLALGATGCEPLPDQTSSDATTETKTNTAPASAPNHDKSESTATSYRTLRPLFWSQLYGEGGTTLYCNERFESERGKGFNIEHVMPMAWVVKTLDCGSRKLCRKSSPRFNEIESDLHNLFPTRTLLNDARSAYAFGMVEGESRHYGDCDFEIDHQRQVVEPAPGIRGEIARAMLYMERSYGIEIFEAQRRLLRQWANDDPVSAEERRRNDRIEALQGRRNLLIDEQ